MPRYIYSEERLQAKMDKLRGETDVQREKYELRKRRELLRRRVHAALFTPRLCMGDPITGDTCTRWAIPGATLCAEHGGTTKAMQYAAKMRLLALVEPAIRVLNKALACQDLNIAVRAAQILLDRSGFHPHATLEVREQPMDLSNMSDMELKTRARKLLRAMDEAVPDLEDFNEQGDTSVH